MRKRFSYKKNSKSSKCTSDKKSHTVRRSTTMASSSDFGFSQCVFSALSQLQMADISLKKEQRSSMEAIFNGHNVFVWLPTGYGKGLCYQVLPFIMDCKRGLVGSQEPSLVLVVRPLVALMVDQVTSLREV